MDTTAVRCAGVAVALGIGLLGCSRAAETDVDADPRLAVKDDALGPHFKNAFRVGDVRFAGKPTKEGLAAARDGGVTVVVNILTDDETAKLEFDEAATASELGLQYVFLPLPDRVPTKEIVGQFADVMDAREGGVLVHCASSNRVGALWAAYQGLYAGATRDEALARGRAAGMRSDKLAAAVETLLPAP